MSRIPYIPENAPFTPEQRMWLNGFLAGLLSDAGAPAPLAESATLKAPLLVLYGSQTGTAETLAKKTAQEAGAKGFAARVVSLEKHDTVQWAAESNVLLITSTYGDGEPPDAAIGFWEWLQSDGAPRLENVRYSVLALGDTNYPAFCEFGKKCDARLAALGATCLQPRTDCDVDYEAPAKQWADAVFAQLTATVGAGPNQPSAPSAKLVSVGNGEAAAENIGYGRKNPFPAPVLRNVRLSREGSAKDVRHFEIGLAGSGLQYEVGDALGVFPSNCPAYVSELLQLLGFDGEEAVLASGAELSLRLALTSHFDITKPSNDLLAAAAKCSPGSDLAALLAPERKDELKKWLYGREVIDVVAGLAQPFAPAEFAGLLKKMAPRLYSISSSMKAHPDEVHLTVGAVRYDAHGRARKGVASTFLADLVGEAGRAPVFVQPSHGFKPPAHGDTAMIMVGPGTGIAPFRAFLQERQATGATGKNWLLFGDQKRSTDYLYEESLEAWRRDGFLHRLDLAFSRDQAEKVYVQTRMFEAAGELWKWLEDGAHFYVCGDALRMAKDVDASLHRIVEQAGGKSADEAKAYVAKLKADKRYQRDVY